MGRPVTQITCLPYLSSPFSLPSLCLLFLLLISFSIFTIFCQSLTPCCLLCILRSFLPSPFYHVFFPFLTSLSLSLHIVPPPPRLPRLGGHASRGKAAGPADCRGEGSLRAGHHPGLHGGAEPRARPPDGAAGALQQSGAPGRPPQAASPAEHPVAQLSEGCEAGE